MMRLVSLDSETTSFDSGTCGIVELYVGEVTANFLAPPVREWYWLLDPGVRIPAHMVAVHGITDSQVAGKPRFEDIAGEVQTVLEGACIIGHNVRRFDVPLLDRLLRAAGQKGLSPSQPMIDTWEWFLRDVPHTLTGAARYYLDEPHPSAHSARHDTEMTLRVAAAQWSRRSSEELDFAAGRKRFLDYEAKFWVDERGIARFGFGKLKGEPVELNRGYLKWMLGQEFSRHVKDVVHALLDGEVSLIAFQPIPAAPSGLHGDEVVAESVNQATSAGP